MAEATGSALGGVSGNRMSGMFSGLDTESIVKAMTSGTLGKIESRKSKLQILTWKQEGYRSVIDKLKDFQDSYLSLTSSTSVRLNSNMQKSLATSSDPRVTVSAGSSAVNGTFSITKAESATKTSISSVGRTGDGAVKLDFSKSDDETKEYKVKLTLDGTTKTITYYGDADTEQAAKNFAAAANTAFDGVKSSDNIFKWDNASKMLSFGADTAGGKTDDGVSHTFMVGYSDNVGLKNDAYNTLSLESKLGSISFTKGALETSPIYRISINNKEFEFTADTTISDMMSSINSSGCGAEMSFDAITGKIKLSAAETGAGGRVDMTQSVGNLLNVLFNTDAVTADSASVSSKMTYDTYGTATANVKNDMVKDIGKNGIEGTKTYTMGMKVNGFDLNITLDSSVFPEGKNYTYKEFDDTVKAEFEKAYQNAYDALVDKTGVPIADDVFDSIKFKTDPTNNVMSVSSTRKDASGDITLTGGTAWTVGSKASTKTVNTMKETNALFTNGDGSTASISFDTAGGTTVIDGTAADGSITVKDLVDSGLFSFSKNGYLIANEAISATAGDVNAESLMNNYFGGKGLTAADPLKGPGSNILDSTAATAAGIYSKGKNSFITIKNANGEDATYENASNTVTFNGTTINLGNIGSLDSVGGTDEAIKIDVSKDHTGIKDTVVKFVDSYNKLIDDLHKLLNTGRPKDNGKFYDPLTEEQRAEMSAEEIEKWESKAKEGHLYNDQLIQKVIDGLHSSMNTAIGGNNIWDMGITLTDSYRDNNKFEIDEAKLEEAIKSNGAGIALLFTDPTKGLGKIMNNAVDAAISTSTSNSGYLVREAGSASGAFDESKSTIYKQLEDYQKLIDNLQSRYEKEQESWWTRFTTLETYLAQMNAQASIFAQ
ncbi:MAG: flagellar filament capping protein FliD [Ruminococcus sp.]|nr:flagellar filament capping protein FliD [Ruminococcus sp.]